MSTYSFSTDYVSYVEPYWLEYLGTLRGRENLQFLEIGSFEGRSAIWFLEHLLTHPTSSITCVDKKFRDVFDINIGLTGVGNKVTKLVGRSQAILPTLPMHAYDLIYIDGSHIAADVLADGCASWRLVKPNGLLIFDDYRWALHKPPSERPKLGVDHFLDEFQTQLRIIHKGYQVIVQKLEQGTN